MSQNYKQYQKYLRNIKPSFYYDQIRGLSVERMRITLATNYSPYHNSINLLRNNTDTIEAIFFFDKSKLTAGTWRGAYASARAWLTNILSSYIQKEKFDFSVYGHWLLVTRWIINLFPFVLVASYLEKMYVSARKVSIFVN